LRRKKNRFIIEENRETLSNKKMYHKKSVEGKIVFALFGQNLPQLNLTFQLFRCFATSLNKLLPAVRAASFAWRRAPRFIASLFF